MIIHDLNKTRQPICSIEPLWSPPNATGWGEADAALNGSDGPPGMLVDAAYD